MILKLQEHIKESNTKKYDMNLKQKTLLFTDIKGSSEFWSKNPEQMFKALNEHENQMIKLSKKYNCIIVKSLGDAFMIAFDNLKGAIDLSIELQESLNKTPIKIGNKKLQLRIGICGGEVYEKVCKIQGHDVIDYFGNVVNTAARLESKISDVGGVAFAYDGKVEDLKLDKYKVNAIEFKEDCRVSDRKRSERLITDVQLYISKNVDELDGVNEILVYKIKI